MSDTQDNEGGYIVEYVTLGSSVKVTAVDPVSLREVSIIGPTSATHKDLADLAIRKLKYMQHKGAEE